jgi:hypothetical protein
LRVVSEQPAKVKLQGDDTDRMPDRKAMVRDVAVFQLKLLADGFRDLLLVPVSIAAALVALLKKGPKPGPEFYDLLRAGRRSEHWINLFGAVDQVHGKKSDDETVRRDDVDQLVSKVESFVVEEYRNGRVTAQARELLERALSSVGKRKP